MEEIIHEMDQNDGDVSQKLYERMGKALYRSKRVYEAMRQELTFFQANQKLKKQVQESREACSGSTSRSI